MDIIKIKKYFPYVYLAVLILIAVYSTYALKSETFDVEQVTDEEKEVPEVKPVKVQFVIEANGNKWTWNKRLQNTDTFEDLLESLRDEEEIYYEKTEYTYGVEYHDINNIYIPEGYVWSVYAGGENVTYKTKGILLNDGWVYRLVLEPKKQ